MSSRIFLVRHGETEWSLNQQHTGSTDIPLTSNGELQALNTAQMFVGDDKLIQPKKIKQVFCSPRLRARQTLQLLKLHEGGKAEPTGVTITDLLQEWDYGNYEGLTIDDVRKSRKSRNLDKARPWNIWKDGCEGGESPRDVTTRLNKLIGEIKRLIGEQPTTEGFDSSRMRNDIVCVAHGHILSALALRWAEQPLQSGMRLLFETAGVGVLCFEHESVDEPAVLLGARADQVDTSTVQTSRHATDKVFTMEQ